MSGDRARKESDDARGAVVTRTHNESGPSAADAPPEGVRASMGNQAMSDLIATAQTKLEVGAAGDRYEREADDVARRVVAAVSSPVANSALGLVTEGPDDAAPVARRVQRRPAIGAAGGPVDAESESLIRSERATGQSLPDGTRQQMEGAFGADFSGVRLHTGARADEVSGRLGAKAFTVGSDVFFRGQAPQLGSRSGMELIAHELTHVVQQGGADTGVQRAFDTDNADFDEITEVKFISAGASNVGVFEIKGSGGKWLVAKFTNEPLSKADKFADTVMRGVGIENRAAAAITRSDPRFDQLCQKLTSVGGKPTTDFMN